MRGLLRQAGGLVCRPSQDRSGYAVLMVTSTRKPHAWLFPKGDIDPGETPARAASREVLEEAGMVARPVQSLGTVHYRDLGFEIELELFLMDAARESGRSWEKRQRRWVPLDAAVRRHHLRAAIAPVADRAKWILRSQRGA